MGVRQRSWTAKPSPTIYFAPKLSAPTHIARRRDDDLVANRNLGQTIPQQCMTISNGESHPARPSEFVPSQTHACNAYGSDVPHVGFPDVLPN
jgi:hypothetical protein